MAVAQNSQSGLFYAKELTYGVMDPAAEFTALSRSTGAFAETRGEIKDTSVHNNRQPRESTQGMSDVAGDFSFDMRADDYDPLFESLMFGEFASGELSIGTVLSSYSFEDRQTDISQFFLTTGAVANTMSLSMSATDNSAVALNFGFVAKEHSKPYQASLSLGDTPASGNIPMTAFNDSIKIANAGGVAADVCITSLDLSFTNNFSQSRCIGSRYATEMVGGQVEITGSLTAVFRNENLYNRFYEETLSLLEIPMSDSSGNLYTISLPATKFLTAGVPMEGSTGERMVTLTFSAFYDAVADNAMVITKS